MSLLSANIESVFLSRVEGPMSRVEGTMSRVEGRGYRRGYFFFSFFFWKNKDVLLSLN